MVPLQSAPDLLPPPVAAGGRWSGTGSSRSSDSQAAGAEAAQAALAGRTAALLLVFCSVSHDIPALLEGVRRQAQPGTVIAGCSSMGELTAAGPLADGVVVVALGGGFEVRTRVGRQASADRRTTGADVAAAYDQLTLPQRLMVLLCDGNTGQQHEIVRGAHAVLGAAVPLVGACAADQLTYTRTYQFHGTGNGVEVLSDAVVGLALGSEGRFGIGLEHGWSKRGTPLVVTASHEGVIEELDGRPAAEVYFAHTGLPAELFDDAPAFSAAAFHHPLGLSRRTGEDIRVIHAADRATGALTCLADVPQGALVWLMQAEPELLIEAGRHSVAAALAALDGEPAVGVVVFDCGARKAMFSPDELGREVAQLAVAAGDVPFAGLYTYGEIARTAGARGMHHLTCVTLAFS